MIMLVICLKVVFSMISLLVIVVSRGIDIFGNWLFFIIGVVVVGFECIFVKIVVEFECY